MTPFAWRRARKYHLPAIRRFVSEREQWCAAFGENLTSPNPLSRHRIFFCSDGKDIIATIQVSFSGNVIPVFSEDYIRESADIPRPRLSTALRPFSIMGNESWVDPVCTWYNAPLRHTIYYYLMARRPGTEPPGYSLPGITVAEMDTGDVERLFPLQKGYEIEEVILTPGSFNERVCRANLRRILADQQVFAALDGNGKALSKANTNAIGMTCEQIGGVYTLPDCRGRGLASCAFAELLGRIHGRHKMPCLFVKKENEAAIALYRRWGFDIRGNFIITYPDRGSR